MQIINTTVADIVKPLVNVQKKLQKHIEAKNVEVGTIDNKMQTLAKTKVDAETEISKAKSYSKKIDGFLNIDEVESEEE